MDHVLIHGGATTTHVIGAVDPLGSTPDEFAAFLRKEIPRWKKIVQDAEVKVEGVR